MLRHEFRREPLKFGPLQQTLFGTPDGAYSTVTGTEYGDSQITLTDYEQFLVESYFGKPNIHRGNVASSPARAKKQFRLYPSGEAVSLNLVYPKPDKDELRLYLSSKAGFKPDPGVVWFVFRKGKDLWLGAEPEHLWRITGRNDREDDRYQEAAEVATAGDSEAAGKIVSSMQYVRDPALAVERFELSGFKCETDTKHPLFVSRASGEPFLEAHHLVPVSLGAYFKGQHLDTLENIYALCPMCHRAVHHARCDRTIEIVDRLIKRRSDALDAFGVSRQEILRMYSCEVIIR